MRKIECSLAAIVRLLSLIRLIEADRNGGGMRPDYPNFRGNFPLSHSERGVMERYLWTRTRVPTYARFYVWPRC